MFSHRFKKDLSLDRVEGILKDHLEQDMVGCRLLQPHPNVVHQDFSPAENADSNLFGLKATGRLRLVAPNEKLTRQSAQRLTECEWSHSPTTLAQGDNPGPCQCSQTLGVKRPHAKSLHRRAICCNKRR